MARCARANWGVAALCTLVLLFLPSLTYQEVLNPPYFNLAENRNITATATCGENVNDKELYCKLVGSNWRDNPDKINIIEGQACDYCDSSDGKKSHSAINAIDGTEKWWQSPPLSRGLEYSEVNLTIDLGQEFHVAYVFLKMGNSPRPGVWVLERSRDHGLTYSPWQYFADTQSECVNFFGPLSIQKISQDDSVVCETKFSTLVPLEGGEISVRLLNNRPNSDHFANSTTLQEWSTATNVRLRFLRPKTTMAHLFFLGHPLDPTITRRFFYSIKDINIGGRCVCNGHAAACDQANPQELYKIECICQHNTCGSQCEKCCDGFNQYEWSRAAPGKPFACEKCNCNGHSDRCHYDSDVAAKNQSVNIRGEYDGGGVCDECQHNTQGINCDKCKPGFYRPMNKPLDAIDVCQPCRCDTKFSTGNCFEGSGICECKENFQSPNCDTCSYGFYDYPECKECDCYRNGTLGNVCERTSGQCPCKPGFAGVNCKECSENFYGFPNCTECECNLSNAIDDKCDSASGQCSCKSNYGGRACDECSVGYFNYPKCEFCQCDRDGTTDEICKRESGECICKPGYSGPRCSQCESGYYGYPNCVKCECNTEGSKNEICDREGKCQCNFNYSGRKCGECTTGFFDFPKCVPCNCQSIGSRGTVCDHSGNCICKDQFEGQKCNKCKEGFYNFPQCEECNCNPAGLVAEFGGCDKMEAGKLCECKSRVKGRICNQCKDLFWNLQVANPNGCEDCLCNQNGTISRIGVCDSLSGQCMCKANVEGRSCNVCKRETYSLQSSNVFGCVDCNCDIGGSISSECEKTTGQCRCKPRIRGRSCSETNEASYFPTLYQFLYEAEDWYNPTGYQARYEYDEELFPDYSWRGYAVFNNLQREILANISISKFSTYRVVLNYVNLNSEPVTGELKFTPSEWASNSEEQQISITFEPTKVPKRVLVTAKQIAGRTLTLEPGVWRASLKLADKSQLYLDYIVLLPQPYYDQSLFDKNKRLCMYNDAESVTCNRYRYPDYSDKSTTMNAIEAFRIDEDKSESKPEAIEDAEYSQKLRADKGFVTLDKNKGNNLMWDLNTDENRTYHVFLNYHTPLNTNLSVPLTVDIISDEDSEKHSNRLVACPYLFTCRQILTDENGEMIVVNVEQNKQKRVSIQLADDDANVNVQSITLVPYNSKWSFDYVKPQFVCVQKDSKCVAFRFPLAVDSVKLEPEADNRDRAIEEPAYMESEASEDSEKPLLVNMDSNQGIEIHGSVKEPGQYAFVLHYYQPKNPSFEIESYIQNGKDLYSGIVSIQHCPSISGCRAVLRQQETNSTFFHVQESYTLTLRSPTNNDLNLDYVLAIPGNSFAEKLLEHPSTDLPNNLMNQCMQSNFYMNTEEVSEQCKKSVFSITTGFNGGALPCQCSIDGSFDHKCNSFGGQCKCKPNVIGRDCSMCKTGYYGFPNCRKCNCPSTAVCHKKTGDCICPKGVTGMKCDKCLPFTFGFDRINGCVDCACNSQGVALMPYSYDRDLTCDLETGACNCKGNVVGRTCDSCKPGFFGFSNCQLCQCDIRGTTEKICNQKTAECFCKRNVQGTACDKCKPDSYYLEEANPQGCTKCFCFGHIDRCRKGQNMVWVQKMSTNKDWEMFNLTVAEETIDVRQMRKNTDYNFDAIGRKFVISLNVLPEQTQSQEQNYDSSVYVSLPKEYVGNRILSYGGSFQYSLLNKVSTTETIQSVTSPDLIFVGQNITIVYQHSQALVENEELTFEIKLRETEFRLLDGRSVSREQFMMTLVRLQAIYLRVKFFDPILEIELHDVLMDTASNASISDAPKALSVEQCACPRGYKGSSCEECAAGYYRIQRGPYLGACVPCNCNGHSKECDPVSGKCFKCQYNTEGDYCDRCIEGFHGDATRGTPQDCMICACPLPISSNNFATSCDVSSSGLVLNCNCKEGYNGTRCDFCAAGHYGRPQYEGYGCKKCECNGNIDVVDPDSCDSTTGTCLKCLNNASGDHCERCAPWFYGDSINVKNCADCSCNKCGSEYCDHITGECTCKTNVIGETCDQCAPGHFGFNQCGGCKACKCQEGAKGHDCDDEGQCECRPGVAGKHCEKCAVGYWGYSKYGCQYCKCNDMFSQHAQCDQLTGQCQCLPGVVGEKCDKCPDRWILIPGEKCEKCGNCIHVLLNETDELQAMIEPISHEIHNTSSAVLAFKKFEFVKEQYQNLSEAVKEKFKETDDRTNLLERFSKAHANIKELTEVDKIDSKSNQLNKNIVLVNGRGQTLLEHSQTLGNEIQSVKEYSATIVENMKILEVSYTNMQNKDQEPRFQDSEEILKELKNIQLTEEWANVVGRPSDVSAKFNETLQSSYNFIRPSLTLKDKIGEVEEKLKNFDELVKDMKNFTLEARSRTIQAEKIIRNDVKNITSNIVDVLNTDNEKVAALITDAYEFTNKSKSSFDETDSMKLDIEQQKANLNETMVKLKKHMEKLSSELPSTIRAKEEAVKHSNSIKSNVQRLSDMFNMTKNIATDPLAAANAYQDIQARIGSADEQIQLAKETIIKINLDNIKDQALVSGVKETAEQARNIAQRTEIFKKKQTEQLNTVSELNDKYQKAIDTINDVDERLANSNIVAGSESFDIKLFKNLVEGSKSREERVNLFNDNITTIREKIEQTVQYNGILNTFRDNLNRVIKDSNKTILSENWIADKKENLRRKREAMDSRISDLKKRIQLAKHQANNVIVGAKFDSDSILELNNPPNLKPSSTYNNFSMRFITEKSDGLLMFIGNGNRDTSPDQKDAEDSGINALKRKKRDSEKKPIDYMAVEIRNKRVTLLWDLGSSEQNILTDSDDVIDNVWHTVNIERFGKIVTMTVTGNTGSDTFTRQSKGLTKGSQSVLDLDANNSAIFIGGMSASFDSSHASLKSRSFEGNISNLMLDNESMGLWNLKMRHNVQGSIAEELIADDTMRFNGNSYVILNKSEEHNFVFDVYATFHFKTHSKNGLMMLISDPVVKSFLSLEIQEGKILLRYDLGSGPTMVVSDGTYNDGKWHVVKFNRQYKESALSVDADDEQSTEVYGRSFELNTDNKIYIGGYPGQQPFHDITKEGFDGCIKELQIGNDHMNMQKNIGSFGATLGCMNFVRSVSFTEQNNGYVLSTIPPSKSDRESLSVSFRFRTLHKMGLMLYLTNKEVSLYVALYLVDGNLMVNAPGAYVKTNELYFNDNNWHYVTVNIRNDGFSLDVDDSHNFAVPFAVGGSFDARQLTKVFIGGVNNDYNKKIDSADMMSSFQGCIGDISLDENYLNFAEADEKSNVHMDKCELEANDVFTLSNLRDIALPSGEEEKEPLTEEKFLKPIGSCRLPPIPQEDLDVTNAAQIRFGRSRSSRYEFAISKDFAKSLEAESEFELSFKTQQAKGVLFYMKSVNFIDFVSLFFSNGSLNYAFDCGSGRAIGALSENNYSDNQWHKVVFNRNGQSGELRVDDEVVSVKSAGKTTSLNIISPIYVGGVSEELSQNLSVRNQFKPPNYQHQTPIHTESFAGCLKDLKVQGNDYSFQEGKGFNVAPCSDNVEIGTFFHYSGGYAVMSESFKVSRQFTMLVDIKPRKSEGIIAAVFGTSDYLALYLDKDRVYFAVDNGKGVVLADAHLGPALCDGTWHSIKVVKVGNFISLSINNGEPISRYGVAGSSSTDTNTQLYIGGIPEYLKETKKSKLKGMTNDYLGCMNIRSINDQTPLISSVEGHVTLNSCPLD